MTEDEVRKIVTYVRSHQPTWKTTHTKSDAPPHERGVSLYDRRSQLLKGSKDYDVEMDELYVRSYLNEPPTQQS